MPSAVPTPSMPAPATRTAALVSRMGALAVGVCLAVSTAITTANAASDYDLAIKEHVFDNGLRLLVLERPGDPRVESKIFTDMGAIHETPGLLGAAHFQEHIMFKGTPSLGSSDWGQEQAIRERMKTVESALIEEKNRARNAIRQRGALDDYRHQLETPRMRELLDQLASLEKDAARFRESGAVSRWYQAFGGTGLTATTEQEYMKFDINLPVERIDLFFRLEADRMSNTVFREFEQERMILVEQRLGDLNKPSTPYYEQVGAAAAAVHPVFWPEGYPTDFYEYTRDSQRKLYKEYFVVNNTTIVLIGGVTLEDMIPRVEHYFGWMERAPEPTRSPAIEPRPAAERRVIYRNDEIEPRVEFRYLIPGVGHPDRATFDVLGKIAEARLTDAMASSGITATVNVNTRVVHTDRFGVPGTMNFELILDESSQLPAAEAALAKTLASLKTAAAKAEVAEAQKRLRVEWYRVARNPSRLAFEIGHFQTMDRWQTLPVYLKARDEASASDIARLASTYFVSNNLTVGIAKPTGKSVSVEAMQ